VAVHQAGFNKTVFQILHFTFYQFSRRQPSAIVFFINTEILLDFQDGGRWPSWIFEM